MIMLDGKLSSREAVTRTGSFTLGHRTPTGAMIMLACIDILTLRGIPTNPPASLTGASLN